MSCLFSEGTSISHPPEEANQEQQAEPVRLSLIETLTEAGAHCLLNQPGKQSDEGQKPGWRREMGVALMSFEMTSSVGEMRRMDRTARNRWHVPAPVVGDRLAGFSAEAATRWGDSERAIAHTGY